MRRWLTLHLDHQWTLRRHPLHPPRSLHFKQYEDLTFRNKFFKYTYTSLSSSASSSRYRCAAILVRFRRYLCAMKPFVTYLAWSSLCLSTRTWGTLDGTLVTRFRKLCKYASVTSTFEVDRPATYVEEFPMLSIISLPWTLDFFGLQEFERHNHLSNNQLIIPFVAGFNGIIFFDSRTAFRLTPSNS